MYHVLCWTDQVVLDYAQKCTFKSSVSYIYFEAHRSLISFLVSYIYLEAASGAVQMLYYRFRPNKVGSCSSPCFPPPCFLLVLVSFLVASW
jgi:hypothetical protein